MNIMQSLIVTGGLAILAGSFVLAWFTGGRPRYLMLFALALPLQRWLTLLPLGAPTAKALGMDVDRSRLVLLALVLVGAFLKTKRGHQD